MIIDALMYKHFNVVRGEGKFHFIYFKTKLSFKCNGVKNTIFSSEILWTKSIKFLIISTYTSVLYLRNGQAVASIGNNLNVYVYLTNLISLQTLGSLLNLKVKFCGFVVLDNIWLLHSTSFNWWWAPMASINWWSNVTQLLKYRTLCTMFKSTLHSPWVKWYFPQHVGGK